MIVLFLLLLVTMSFANESDLFFDSVIIIKGDRSSVDNSGDDSRVRGIRAKIDWDKVPDLGIQKEEIYLIEIIKRENVSFDSDKIKMSPSEWRFVSPNWVLEHKGSIPYLENLEFLLEKDLQAFNTIQTTKNSLGYFQDSNTRLTGLYQSINHPSKDTVSLVHVLSAEENQYIYDMSRKLDTQIIAEEILKIQEKPVEAPDTPEITPLEQTTQTELLEEVHPTTTDDIVNDIVDKAPPRPRVETSVEKRQNTQN